MIVLWIHQHWSKYISLSRRFHGFSTMTHLIFLSTDMAQMFLQRRSRLCVVCWMESFSESLPQASASWSSTSQSVNTDATLAVCCSMSRCRSYRPFRTKHNHSPSFLIPLDTHLFQTAGCSVQTQMWEIKWLKNMKKLWRKVIGVKDVFNFSIKMR